MAAAERIIRVTNHKEEIETVENKLKYKSKVKERMFTLWNPRNDVDHDVFEYIPVNQNSKRTVKFKLY